MQESCNNTIFSCPCKGQSCRNLDAHKEQEREHTCQGCEPRQSAFHFRELNIVRSSTEEPLVLELASITAQLAEARNQAEQANAAASEAAAEVKLAQLGCQWAEDRLAEMEK